MGFFLSGIGASNKVSDDALESVVQTVVSKVDGIIDSKFDNKTQALTNQVNQVVESQNRIDNDFNNVVMCKKA